MLVYQRVEIYNQQFQGTIFILMVGLTYKVICISKWPQVASESCRPTTPSNFRLTVNMASHYLRLADSFQRKHPQLKRNIQIISLKLIAIATPENRGLKSENSSINHLIFRGELLVSGLGICIFFWWLIFVKMETLKWVSCWVEDIHGVPSLGFVKVADVRWYPFCHAW